MSNYLDRKITRGVWFLLILGMIVCTGCALPSSSPVGTSPTQAQDQEAALPYFGLDFPTDQVQRFAPAIFKEEMHAPPIFTPDGREVYWSLMDKPGGVRFMKIENGAWTEPAPAPFDRIKLGDSPFISSDGTHLLFLSWSGGTETIRQVDRADGKWGSPQKLPDEVNGNGAHWQASMADNGNLYFGSAGKVYFSALENDTYTVAEVMKLFDNTDNSYTGSPFIAPDESYLIFDYAEGGTAYTDLFITFRNEAGGWDKPVALDVLNSGLHELYANVSPNGRFLIFLSNRTGGILLPYWVDAGIIEDYRSQSE